MPGMLDIGCRSLDIVFGGAFSLSLHRTLRIPDDGRVYPLPPGFGPLPIVPAADCADRVPSHWKMPNVLLVPLRQFEAVWLSFTSLSGQPHAVTVAAGRSNAVSGQLDDLRLRSPQNYLVCPPQLWLDGLNLTEDKVRQFVAVPLGQGLSVDEQRGIEGSSALNVRVHPPIQPLPVPEHGRDPSEAPVGAPAGALGGLKPGVAGLGMAPGGTMRQKIYQDPWGVDTWSSDRCGEVVIHVLNSAQYQAVTGVPPPPTPISAETYIRLGLPWYEIYDRDVPGVSPSSPCGSGAVGVPDGKTQSV